ncbi:MAG: hypothetical protein MZU84_04620 [Sphingobacterium sp.]|nr:hypothetical protein [Sphingobacterium sp.]
MSTTGALAYVPGGIPPTLLARWFGSTVPETFSHSQFRQEATSTSVFGRRPAAGRLDDRMDRNVWVYDIRRGDV